MMSPDSCCRDCRIEWDDRLGERRYLVVHCPLHAAVPDLLAALRTTEAEIVTLMARLSHSYARNMEALLIVIRAAIAKAKWRNE